MSAYSHLPPIKPPRSMQWYADVAAEKDDELEEGLAILESFRPLLAPAGKGCAVDEAKELLRSAAELYAQTRCAQERLSADPNALADLLPPAKRKLLMELCALISRGAEE